MVLWLSIKGSFVHSVMEPFQQSSNSSDEEKLNKADEKSSLSKEKGPLSFLSGALTSIFFTWLSFFISKKVVIYFALHSPSYTSPIAQSIASAMKTLAIGICFLATFTFGFIGIGLTIVFIRSLFTVNSIKDD